MSNKSQRTTQTCLGDRCFQWYRDIAHCTVGLREALVNDSEVVAEYQKSKGYTRLEC